jgi:hypothetical protein
MRESRSCGSLSVFRLAKRAVSIWDRWEGEWWRCRLSEQMFSFVAGASECRAKRETGLDKRARNHRGGTGLG